MAGGPHHRGMAVACRHSDHNIGRFDQGKMRGHRRAGHPIEHCDVIGFSGTAEVFEGQLSEPIEGQRRRELVISELKLFGGERQAVLEPREDVGSVQAATADHRPSNLQLLEVVLGSTQNVAAGIGQVWGMRVAKAIDAHPRSPSKNSAGDGGYNAPLSARRAMLSLRLHAPRSVEALP